MALVLAPRDGMRLVFADPIAKAALASMRELVDTLESRLGPSWARVVAWLRDANSLGDVESRIQAGDYDGALQGIETAARAFASDANSARNVASNEAATWLGGQTGNLISFDAHNDSAVAEARRAAGDLITAITQDQRAVVRAMIEDGVHRGANPREVARDIRYSIGLTPTQATYVQNFRQELESGNFAAARARQLVDGRQARTLASAQAGRTTLTPAQITNMVNTYTNNWVAWRAETIARTEGLRAAHAGQNATYAQAVANGDVDPSELRNRWNHVKRGRFWRPFHATMHGQEREWGQPFTSGLGNSLMYPCDPDAPPEETVNCHCMVTTRYVRNRGATRPSPARNVQPPPGFGNPTNARVISGAPRRDRIDPGALYRVSPSSIADKLIALPGAGTDETRLQNIRDAFAQDKQLGPVSIGILPNGKMFVDDGRHRLIVSSEQDRDVLVRFSESIDGVDAGTVPLLPAK